MTDPNRKAFNSTLRIGRGFKKLTLAEAIAKRMEKRGHVLTITHDSEKIKKLLSRTSKTDKQKAKAKADKYFSMFIRLRDSDEFGIATCITSGKRGHWKTMDAGHYISRAKESTRYDECNVNCQGKMSNRFQGGHFLEHGIAIDKKFGTGTRATLELKARVPCKRTTSDYLFLADCYRQKVEWIKQNEPGKFLS